MLELLQEAIETLETDGKDLSKEQQKYLYDRYHTHLTFRYAEGHLCYIFQAKSTEFEKMEHFLGLQYEKKEIDFFAEGNGLVIVSYNLCDRLDTLFEQLENAENVL